MVALAHQQHSCHDCPTGKYADQTEQSACKGGPVCSPGYYGQVRAQSDADQHCSACPAGQFQPVSGQSDCLRCPGGKYRASAGGSMCDGSACSPGQYNPVAVAIDASVACTDCPAGQYALLGAWSCEACPRGKHQYKPGMGTCDDDETCRPFYFFENGTCDNLRAKYVVWLAGVAWTLFVVGLVSCCSCMEFHESGILATLIGIGVGIETTRATNTPIKDDNFIAMAVFTAFAALSLMMCAFRKYRGMCTTAAVGAK